MSLMLTQTEIIVRIRRVFRKKQTVCEIWINGNYKIVSFFIIITINICKKNTLYRIIKIIQPKKLRILTILLMIWLGLQPSRPPTLGQNLES